jgi:hypothetical protein
MTQDAQDKIIYDFEDMSAHEINTLDRLMRRTYCKLYINEDSYFYIDAKYGNMNYMTEDGDTDIIGVDLAEALHNEGEITSCYILKSDR